MGKITALVFPRVFCGFRVGGVLYWESLGCGEDTAGRSLWLDVEGLSEGVPVWHLT